MTIDVSAASKRNNCRDVLFFSDPVSSGDAVRVTLQVQSDLATNNGKLYPARWLFHQFLVQFKDKRDFKDTLYNIFDIANPKFVPLQDCGGFLLPSCVRCLCGPCFEAAAAISLYGASSGLSCCSLNVLSQSSASIELTSSRTLSPSESPHLSSLCDTLCT